jgi:hypothetical protein
MIYKKLLILSAVGVVSYATTNFNFVNSDAALSKPSPYTLGYFQETGTNDWLLTTPTLGSSGAYNPYYDRTGSAPNYDYNIKGITGTGLDNDDYSIIPVGLTINMRFNASNSNWFSSGSNYYPGGGGIGSDDSVGGHEKIYLRFVNITNRDYTLYFDRSSSNSTFPFFIQYDNFSYGGQFNAQSLAYDNNLNTILVPNNYTTTIVSASSSALNYFDAWYLHETGIAPSWQAGYDEGLLDGDDYYAGYDAGYSNGYNEGLSGMPIQSIFTSIFGGIANIFNISIFGGITLGTIVLAPIAVSLMWFMLGLISGVGGKK